MSMIDASFLFTERAEAPQHGSVLFILRRPDGASGDYMHRLFVTMRDTPVTAEKFNCVLASGPIDRVAPAWRVLSADEIDIDYHFRHSALPAPGGELELGLLISRLVAHPLDLARPPWEIHLIEGLEGGRFALYMKMHHALVDGMSLLRMVRHWLTGDPADTTVVPLWATEAPDRGKRFTRSPRSPIRRAFETAVAPISALPEVGGAVLSSVGAALGTGGDLVAPYTAPRSILNGPVTRRRRISTQRLELARVRRLADETDSTLNDAVAVLLGTALRRYLDDLDALPRRPLVGGVLASLRAAAEGSSAADGGNVISFIFADLATDTDDIVERAERVRASTRAGKDHLLGLRANAMTYSTLMLAPMFTSMIAGQGHRALPLHNVGLSNVPGTDKPLYYNGAEVEALHATTIIAHGQALIVTVTSWNGTLAFTLTACPDTVPHSQRIAVYLADALDEFEAALA